VKDAAGQTVNVLVADIETDPLHDLLKDLKRHAPGDGSACLLDKKGLVLMTTDPQALLFSPHPDVTGGALRASLDQNATGYLVYWNAHGRQQMAGYSRCRLQLNRRLDHFRVRFLHLNRRLNRIFAAKS
jgi:hypothetical protein